MSKKFRIQIGATFLYNEAKFRSQIISQAILGDAIELLGPETSKWVQVKMWDGYVGWLSKSTIVQEPAEWENHEFFAPNQLLSRIYESPDLFSTPIRDITLGSRLPLLARQDHWVKILLPTGETGWMENDAFGNYGKPDIEKLIHTSLRFIGIPYLWGGTTPRGIDCSGFTQLLFRLNGILLKRDASIQYEQGEKVSDSWEDWQAGDLVFFSENENNSITHVGIIMGDGDFIHSSTSVKINSLNSDHEKLYSKTYHEQFIGVKRIGTF